MILLNYLFKLIIDCLYSLVLISNLVILVWRSIWDIQDLYLAENLFINYLITLLISYILMISIKIYQQYINQDLINFTNDHSFNQLKIKFIIFIFSFANINHWRAIWSLTDYLTEFDLYANISSSHKSNDSLVGHLIIGLLSILCLCSMKRINSLMGVPFQINDDSIEIALKIQPYNQLNDSIYNQLEKWQFFAYFLYEYITDFFTIEIWRSYWNFLDKYTGGDSSDSSAFFCLASGSLIYIIFYLLKTPINRFLLPLSGENCSILKKLILKIFFILIALISFISITNIWRALWILQTNYLYFGYTDNDKLIKLMISILWILTGTLVLFFINKLSVLLSRGNCKDDVYFLRNKLIISSPTGDLLIKNMDNKSKLKCFTELKNRIIEKDKFLNYFERQNSNKSYIGMISQQETNKKFII